ncbi:MAG: hypothetical protein AAF125_04330, partial [Chloroflexota bacterium]
MTAKPNANHIALSGLFAVIIIFNVYLLLLNPLNLARLEAGTVVELGEKSQENRLILYGGWRMFYDNPDITISPEILHHFWIFEDDMRVLGGVSTITVAPVADTGVVVTDDARIYQGTPAMVQEPLPNAVDSIASDPQFDLSVPFEIVFMPVEAGEPLVVFLRGDQLITAGAEE